MAKKARGLGKGLDALFGDMEVSVEPSSKEEESSAVHDIEAAETHEGIKYIDINNIKPNANQPRKTFDEGKLEELADSIREHGLIQPLVVRKSTNGYEIVAGERRWRAARKIGIKEIPAIVRELSDEENMLLAIIENMQREDLDPIEEAEGISQMIETYGLSQEQVSKSLGKSRPYITNQLRLLKLPEEIRKMVSDGRLSSGHVRALITIDDEEKQIKLAVQAVEQGLSVRQVEALAKANKNVKKSKAAKKKKSADVKRVEEDLKVALGTKVNLNQNGKKGKIEIEFYSKDELERLIELLKSLG
ncbi:MAG: ParB/RepB/Spo0J family partition protein [Clostridiales bacterium]|nr:ParB/RepB/Spo0J family partition protein [Clostridiales bacterium]MDD7015883.1 ParB/RepB/Spo0J family partition protein [Bacillota bacterium]